MNLAALVTIGFVKDAKYHIDVQGFNVYHKKNQLTKPFWSDGRGVIDVFEALNKIGFSLDPSAFYTTLLPSGQAISYLGLATAFYLLHVPFPCISNMPTILQQEIQQKIGV